MQLSIVILAAGQGKRMNSDRPKVLQPLAGRPLLGHVIATARSLEPTRIEVVYGHGGDQVRAAFAGEPLGWALQAEQLGTGHALMQAMPAIADDQLVLVLYGDVPLIRRETLAALVALAGPDAMSLLTVELPDPTGYGRIVRDAAARVLKIVEQKDATPQQCAIREGNTGVMAVPARLLRRWLGQLRNANAQGEYYLTDIVEMAVAEQVEVRPLVAPTVPEVLGINDRLQLAEVEAEYRRLRARELLQAGVTLADPARVDVRGTLVTGRDVFIDVNVVFEGEVRLGDRVRIGPNCVIRDASLGTDTQVLPCCVIESATIGANCNIGPFARTRPQVTLADEVHIGNFVEVKNSRLGPGAKANHLAYVGDATVGARVNIGAGTIVANYDGANKHRTIIGDDAHTGSNSVLVAPIDVGPGATVGAGSTVTRAVPAGKLTVARAKQVTLDNWRRPVKKPKAER
ncbi:MAG: bifunctional UDP-N-acetylglucosamine diphosphorylase/glucosamine-1-phosphate N-acetyltransferase GlmU [Sinobacteraceae bacterium]|nr:bifunctional UDP-N-acetylglucosamine diphosphorylase/glucosamine-1-phosphate N-acetyltransferase GlmU [Nevskiaceae bacterium]MCP5466674.1 bifunctional UDP-N-acetylglucosamine diphosphorylase/glucosamine-1-phosphate N-acetyltransferase GlmU [Nevskiaceae bacterium]